jgi:hypothetical protein
VQRELANGRTRDDQLDARVRDLLEDLERGSAWLAARPQCWHLFHVLLLAVCEVEKFFARLEEHGALRLALRDVERTRVHGDLGGAEGADVALGLAPEDHTLHDAAGREAAAHDLDDANVVDVERLWVRWHHRKGGLGDECGEGILMPVLLGSDGRTQS